MLRECARKSVHTLAITTLYNSMGRNSQGRLAASDELAERIIDAMMRELVPASHTRYQEVQAIRSQAGAGRVAEVVFEHLVLRHRSRDTHQTFRT